MIKKIVGLYLISLVVLFLNLNDVKAATITVCSSGCTYTTINAAVEASNQGDTINVSNGTYNYSENDYNMTISKNLTIIGQSRTGTILKFGFSINSSKVLTLKKVTLALEDINLGETLIAGILVAENATLNIEDVLIRNIDRGYGIYLESQANITADNIEIKYIRLYGYGIITEADNGAKNINLSNVKIVDIISDGDGMYLKSSDNIVLNNITINTVTRIGIRILAAKNVTLNNATITNAGINGVNIANVTEEITLSDIEVNYAGGDGIYITNSVNTEISDLIVRNSIGDGITVRNTENTYCNFTMNNSKMTGVGNDSDKIKAGIVILGPIIATINNVEISNYLGDSEGISSAFAILSELSNKAKATITNSYFHGNQADLYLGDSTYKNSAEVTVVNSILNSGKSYVRSGSKLIANDNYWGTSTPNLTVGHIFESFTGETPDITATKFYVSADLVGTGIYAISLKDASLVINKMGNIEFLINKNNNPNAISYTYNSSDGTIASVNSDGVITGLKLGNATITITVTIAKGNNPVIKTFELPIEVSAVDTTSENTKTVEENPKTGIGIYTYITIVLVLGSIGTYLYITNKHKYN